MRNLYIIKDQQTGYCGAILEAADTGEAKANLQAVLSSMNHENPLVKSMVECSALYHVGVFDPDQLLVSPVPATLVCNLTAIPLLPAAVDEEVIPDA